ncbi:MAG: hypothetical protein CVV64_13620 [Candidatus Wallbacteria bacterium HGW-Wallbacteria-1]|jgi:hypothetical protein|uniref:DUF6873 domain-containing protein n=1 Tax=Candidatus Wallbacteria bacterium HGW-Wallbacteria-1 TaxID=2013854 RepID=A0A2N1PMQ0_9BACT|nr:MAG: hypothetical protein CVV64_13620 [Candidatus Wallbacteria bacterium HGW-Wallbacteria-1]
MTIAIVSVLAPLPFHRWLESLGFTLLKFMGTPGPDERICCHPDLHIASLGSDLKVVSPALDRILDSFLPFDRSKTAHNLITGCCSPRSPYPNDCHYNVIRIKNRIISGSDPDPQIIAAAKSRGLTIVTAKQGYVRCSALPLGEGIITADPSLIKLAQKEGIPHLEVPQGLASLRGFDYGFIGGAFGLLEDQCRALACGSRNSIPSKWADALESFARQMGWNILWFPEHPANGFSPEPYLGLEDIGSVFFLKSMSIGLQT